MLPIADDNEVKGIPGSFTIPTKCAAGQLFEILAQTFQIQVPVPDFGLRIQVVEIDLLEISLEAGDELGELK